MARYLLVAGLMLVGCGGDEEGADSPPPDTNQIERLSAPKEAVEDPLTGAQLEPLTPRDLAGAGMTASACAFTSNGALFVAATANDTLVRFAGRVLHLVQSGPVGPSGAFFENNTLSISIGRTQADTGDDGSVGAPARATIVNRRSRAKVELTGLWRCRT